MGGETILVIYEGKKLGRGQVDIDQIVSALETLQKKKNFDIKSYSFQEIADKDTVKFSKALIICHDGSRFSGKITDITARFDEENAGEFRVLIPGLATVPKKGSIPTNNFITTQKIDDISTWWPKVLHFLFPRMYKDGKALSCLILFDGNSAVQNVEENQWFQKTKKALEPIGMTCLWFQDIENGVVALDGEKTPGMTVVLTDDANSDVCRKIHKGVKKVYIYPTENPMEMSLIGWAALLKELKIITCEDTAFKEARSKRKMMLIILILVLLFVVLPLVPATIAAVIALAYFGVDVGKICDLCCCICPGMGECITNLPCCWFCCITVCPNKSGAVFVINTEALEAVEVQENVQETV